MTTVLMPNNIYLTLTMRRQTDCKHGDMSLDDTFPSISLCQYYLAKGTSLSTDCTDISKI